MGTAEKYREDLKSAASHFVDDLVESGTVTDFSAPARRATMQAMAEAARRANRLNDRVGPFYSTERVARLLGDISRQAVSERARNHRLLRVTTADGLMVFPAFQFTGTAVRTNLVPLLQILLGSGADPWTVAYWMTAPQEELGDKTALAVLDSEDEARRLQEIAKRDAAAWHAAA